MQVSKDLKLGINSYTITGTGDDFHSALMDLEKVSIYNISECGLCKSELLSLRAYTTQEGGYKYIKVTCGKCKGALTLGEAKKTHANYYRRNAEGGLDWKEFEGKKETAKTASGGGDIDWD